MIKKILKYLKISITQILKGLDLWAAKLRGAMGATGSFTERMGHVSRCGAARALIPNGFVKVIEEKTEKYQCQQMSTLILLGYILLLPSRILIFISLSEKQSVHAFRKQYKNIQKVCLNHYAIHCTV